MRLIDSTLTKDAGLVGRSFKHYLVTSALTATGLVAMMTPAMADNWTDHVGDGITIDTTQPNTTNITQTLDTVKVHGDGDINAGWTVNVAQPSSSSKYVLYDIENDPTEILGTLNANGRVYIFDQNGVVFGAGSQVNVGSIVTSTGFISDENLAQDKLVFENVGGAGIIENKGTINVSQAGLAAFVAPTVVNSGVINAKLGTVAMASGNTVTLDLYGDNLVEIAVDGELENALIENSGTIAAEGGNIAITAAAAKDAVDNVINMSGVADVSSVTVKGGKIILGGDNKGTVKVSGKLDASGTSGGDINITGQAVVLDAGSELVADAGQNGDGGKIGAFGNSYAIMGGSASARGGQNGGNGGFIELSAKEGVGFSGLVDTSAATGKTGTFLIDPDTINLGNFAPFDFGTLANLKVDAQALANTLRFSNIHLWATNNIFTSANIDLSTWQGLIPSNKGITANDLTLSANTIDINHDITLGAGDLIVRDALTSDSVFGFGLGGPASDINLQTVNLNAQILARDTVGGATSVNNLSAGQISGLAEIVNVISPLALINQAIAFVQSAGTVNIGSGTYNQGDINVNKSILISGAGKNQTILNASGYNTGFTIDSDLGNTNVTLRRMTVNNAKQDGVVVKETGNLKVLQMNQMAFNKNGEHGVAVYGNGPNEIRILNSDFLDNGWGGGSKGEGDIMAYLYNGDVTLTNVTIENNSPVGLADYGVQIRGSDTFGPSGTIALDNVQIAGRYRAALLGIQRFTETDISMNDVVLGGDTNAGTGSSGWGALYLSNIGTTPVDIGNTSFLPVAGQYIENDSAANIDARDASFEGINGAGATLDENFAIEDKVRHALDIPSRGLVTWKDGHVFVTQASGSIQRGIDASDANGTVHVDDGTFTEQLVINKNLSLLGDGAYNTTILNAPTVMVNSYTQDGRDNYAIVYVHDAANVNIDGFQINGATNTGNIYNDNARFVGVAYQNAGGSFTNNWVKDIATAGNTSRSGFALLATAKNTNSILNIDNNEFTGFQRYGIALADTKLSATVTRNTITGNKDINPVEQSGIFVTQNPAVTVGGLDPANGNTISEVDNGIELFREHSSLYQNNSIMNVGRGFYINASNSNMIADNFIDGATDTAIYSRISIYNDIRRNKIRNSANGITLDDSDHTTVAGNSLRFLTGNGISAISSDDGDIKNNRINNVDGFGIEASSSLDARIHNNTVFKTGGNGINILASENAVVTNNMIGAKAGVAQGTDNIHGDGIHAVGANGMRIQGNYVTETTGGAGQGSGIYVENSNNARIGGAGSKANTISNAAWDGIKIEGGDSVVIDNNSVSNIDRVGIYAAHATNLLIKNNVVDNTTFGIGSPYGGISTDWGSDIRILGNTISNSGQGVRMYNAGGSNRIGRNVIDDVSDNGIHVYDMLAGSSVRIDRNVIGYGADGLSRTADDTLIGGNGIYVSSAPEASILRNNIINAGLNGIYAAGLANATFVRNLVERSAVAGLYLAGPSNGYALVAGNTFRRNDTGAIFESGTIDLTDARANRFIGGSVGIRFAPYPLTKEAAPAFASLELIDDDGGPDSAYVPGVQPANYGGTIGGQIFRNQSGSFIELTNQAFFSPGNPTWINATNSRFISTVDGYDITPSDFAGLILPADQIAFLESMIYHFPDGQLVSPAQNLGIFFFGSEPAVIDPLADINQSLIFNRFVAFNGDQTGLSVQIRGLPTLPGRGGNIGANFNNINTFAGNPADLNNIETAAGRQQTGTTEEDLNDIETAAGGSNENCWGNAANNAGGGQVVNIVYNGSFADNMNDVAACGL